MFCRCSNDDRLCQVQGCENRHNWFYGPGLYLCAKHMDEIDRGRPVTPMESGTADANEYGWKPRDGYGRHWVGRPASEAEGHEGTGMTENDLLWPFGSPVNPLGDEEPAA